MPAELLERKDEVAALHRLVEAAQSGTGRFAVVEGTAGIGKSRLLAEAKELAGDADFRLSAGRCSDIDQSFSYGLVRQLIEPIMSAANSDERNAWMRGASAAEGLLAGHAGSQPPSGDFAVTYALFRLVVNLSGDRPTMFVVDDLQWGDVPSIRFLEYLLRNVENLPVVVVAAVRLGDGVDATARLIELITSDPACTVLRPRPLTRTAVERLVKTMTGNTTVSAQFVDSSRTITRGNPLMLRSMIGLLIHEHVDFEQLDLAELTQLGSAAVARYVAARLQRVPKDCLYLARALSVLGDGSQLTLVATMADMPMTDALKAVTLLDSGGIVDIASDDHDHPGLAFTHPLVRAAVYDSIPLHDRIASHASAAVVLAKMGADAERSAAHLLRVPPGLVSESVGVLRRAAAEAVRNGAPSEAYRYVRRSLSEQPATPAQRLALLRLAGALSATDAPAASEMHIREAAALTTDPVIQAEIAIELGHALFILGRLEESIAVCRDAIAKLPEGLDELHRFAGACIVGACIRAGQNPKHEALVEEFRRLPPVGTLASDYLDASLALYECFAGDPGATVRARRALSGGLAHTTRVGAGLAVGHALHTLLAADVDDAMRLIDDAVDWAHRTGSSGSVVAVRFARVRGWLWRGDLVEAAAELETVRSTLLTIGPNLGQSIYGRVAVETYIALGRPDDAENALAWSGAPAAMESSASPSRLDAYLLMAHAILARTRGSYEQALAMSLAIGERTDFVASNPAIMPWRSEAAQSLIALGDRQRASDLSEAELEAARAWSAPRAIGHALRICAASNDGPRAITMLEEAVATLEPSPARLELAHVQADLGAALRRSNQRTAARTLLGRGLELAERCGATLLAQRARSELRLAGGRPRRTVMTGPDSLTPSEKRVAGLVLGGASNREIAQVLFVTHKTVEVHLTNAYRKLGVKNRLGLAKALQPPR